MTPTREEVIRVARECEMDFLIGPRWQEQFERFAQHFYEAGAAAAREPLRSAYAAGLKRAAKWADRTDLISDIGSPAYEQDHSAALAKATGEKT